MILLNRFNFFDTLPTFTIYVIGYFKFLFGILMRDFILLGIFYPNNKIFVFCIYFKAMPGCIFGIFYKDQKNTVDSNSTLIVKSLRFCYFTGNCFRLGCCLPECS